jgi:dTDP-4-dehydrorhamnose reductase
VVFDGEHAPYDERAAPSPITAYGSSKALAEQAVLDACPGAVIVRTSLIYGFAPVDPRTRQLLDGEMPNLFTDEYRCPINVDDLADALLELADGEWRGVVNIAGPARMSRYEFGCMIANAYGIQPRFRPALSGSNSTPRPRDCALDISLARRLLRTRLRPFEAVASDFFGRERARG